MPDPTPRLGLENPKKGAFDWENSWYGNCTKLDENPGVFVCTTATRPDKKWVGRVIYDADENKLFAWNGSEWVLV